MKEPKTHVFISIDEEKAFDKIQHLFVIKTANNLEVQGNCFNIIKSCM